MYLLAVAAAASVAAADLGCDAALLGRAGIIGPIPVDYPTMVGVQFFVYGTDPARDPQSHYCRVDSVDRAPARRFRIQGFFRCCAKRSWAK